MRKKILCFDLDNTLCKTVGNNYKNSKPFKKKILLVNSLRQKGYYIKIFTARFMGRSQEKASIAKKKGYISTLKQLKSWNLMYDELIFGKPSFDLLIDDKSLNFKHNWTIELIKKLKH
jgi:hypothetical protein